MIEEKVSNWSDFIEEAGEATSQLDILFRGMRNHKWELLTTLERIGRKDESLSQYYTAINIARSSIECCIDHKWDFKEELSDADLKPDILSTGLYHLPSQEYMIYLRHHGFPSPLLDWTESPYVAAYFAYADANPDDEYCSIYRFIEFGKNGKGGIFKPDDAKILSIGPCISTHKRHFMQQSQYTYSVRKSDRGLIFSSHEDAMNVPGRDGDHFIKYILPISERTGVLRELRKMNITAYTLFGTEDSLIRTLTQDEYILRGSS